MLSPVSQPEIQTPKRKTAVRGNQDSASASSTKDEGHNAFAALLAAGRVLNRESASDDSTNRSQYGQHQRNGHGRASHSFSSHPMTPSRSHDERQYLSPVANSHGRGFSYSMERDRYDRDSTISASDDDDGEEEVVTDRDVSHHDPVNNRQETSAAPNAAKSSSLLQTKLFGQVRKAGVERSPAKPKRKASFEHTGSTKKPRAGDSAGLGISLQSESRA